MDNALIRGVEGFLTIRDQATQEILVEKHNAVHFGNLSAAIAKALAGDANGHIRYMAFGNGGTSIASNGTIYYRSPNVNTVRDSTAALYNQTYQKDMSIADAENNVVVDLSNSSFADITAKATLGFGEPAGQDTVDNAINNDGDFVFDEIGLATHEGWLITHVLFHPVQKSLNRVVEVDYTLRIQMG